MFSLPDRLAICQEDPVLTGRWVQCDIAARNGHAVGRRQIYSLFRDMFQMTVM